VVAGRASASRLVHATEAPDVTGCRGISYSGHFPGQPAVVRVPPPPSGMGETARHHRTSPQGAELTARDINFSWLRRRGGVGGGRGGQRMHARARRLTCPLLHNASQQSAVVYPWPLRRKEWAARQRATGTLAAGVRLS
jgi:hypothetical protein